MTKSRVGPSAVALALLLVGISRAQDQADPATLTLTESAGNYVLTVPLSRLTLTIPKGGLVPQPPSGGGAAAANSNYFNFTHKDRALNASGWFSPAGGFRGIQEFWTAQLPGLKRTGLPEPRNVSFEQVGSWSVVSYDVEIPGIASAHMRANWVEAGTWIDVHLSLTSDRSAGLRDELKAFLKTMTVSVKGEAP